MKSSSTSAVSRLNTFSLVGALIGLTTFLIVGLLPSMLFGGAVGMQLASGIFGLADAHTFGANAFIVLGIVSAATIVALLFAALGAAAGASIDALTRTTVMHRA